MRQEEQELVEYINALQRSFNSLAKKNDYSEFAYLTYEDISKLSCTEGNKANKLIILKAPPGTEMEMPDPEEVESYFKKEQETKESHKEEVDAENKKYQLYIKSKTDEIMVYAVENEEGESDEPPAVPIEGNNPNKAESLSKMYDN